MTTESTAAPKPEALSVRDAALEIVRKVGKPITTSGRTPVRATMAIADDLRIAHNTPFTAQPAAPEEMCRALLRAGRLPLPYTLDVWVGKTKTFSIAWSKDEFRVTTFKRGPWIDRLLTGSSARVR
jgi:hypothetical protein